MNLVTPNGYQQKNQIKKWTLASIAFICLIDTAEKINYSKNSHSNGNLLVGSDGAEEQLLLSPWHRLEEQSQQSLGTTAAANKKNYFK